MLRGQVCEERRNEELKIDCLFRSTIVERLIINILDI